MKAASISSRCWWLHTEQFRWCLPKLPGASALLRWAILILCSKWRGVGSLKSIGGILDDTATPNESEAHMLLGRPPGRIDGADIVKTAEDLLSLGVGAVVLKLGDQGCFYADAQARHRVLAPKVDAVDTTAAGDVFNAALAVALAEDKPVPEALVWANAAAALSTTRPGAQSSVPRRSEVEAFRKSWAS